MSLPDPRERPLLKVDELLELVDLPMSRATIYRAIEEGQLPAFSVGRKKYLITAQLAARLGLEPPLSAAAGSEREEVPAAVGTSSTPNPPPTEDTVSDGTIQQHPPSGPRPAA